MGGTPAQCKQTCCTTAACKPWVDCVTPSCGPICF
jgi:hypothetical protein